MQDVEPLVRWQDEECERERKPEAGVAMRLLKKRTVFLTGEINQESADRIKSQLLLLGEEDGDEPVRVYINSPGGDADAGYSIYDTMRFIESPIKAVGTGLVASAAVLVLLGAPAGSRFLMPNSRVLIHQPSTSLRGAAADIQIEASEILKLRERLNTLIAEETGQSVEKVANDTRRNCWLSAEGAVDYGLVDKVITSRKEL